ncbi:MAG: 30S ribosomal protein S11 [Deltaproteobacteria bacterium GWA2_38_16]|nr:MAG: 30S ribosomal protein S11 [Deltaproteobacteria bacterium GWA2_38_16]OGQ03806.1 MAG: 30S ribosomal protein S11 [Deltaproteobacteria bacterium RIFCSPHIGHO2_02_FULL_38_15]OGQ34300.1 MAG: 30S ribosomal protein S11 [Deltaproteobacteria bacterium RIFCSPLOWO2_01_FULL_38_9]OGQ59154.1 MAG: 30S ribosomal protein S11 [Deltaproteobacteria bacterium RIFCSPLOWO2_12_FULL_38_8]HBQ20848.1 30S ribosomal protein S11 [Deltaproteobacteria bacterium]
MAEETQQTPQEPQASEGKETKKVKTPKKKKIKVNIPSGNAYVHASFNNTIITITDPKGDVVAWSTAGSKGFKGSRKGTPFAAQVAAEDAARKAVEACGMKIVNVMVSGPGSGRESSLRALQAAGLRIAFIKDITPIPHNGCRPSKRRRV